MGHRHPRRRGGHLVGAGQPAESSHESCGHEAVAVGVPPAIPRGTDAPGHLQLPHPGPRVPRAPRQLAAPSAPRPGANCHISRGGPSPPPPARPRGRPQGPPPRGAPEARRRRAARALPPRRRRRRARRVSPGWPRGRGLEAPGKARHFLQDGGELLVRVPALPLSCPPRSPRTRRGGPARPAARPRAALSTAGNPKKCGCKRWSHGATDASHEPPNLLSAPPAGSR